MKPPFCEICDAPCDADGLLSFRKTPSDVEWERRMQEGGGVGHPPWQGWFCPRHREGALRLTQGTLPEARSRMR